MIKVEILRDYFPNQWEEERQKDSEMKYKSGTKRSWTKKTIEAQK
jgi:hypothetical protein